MADEVDTLSEKIIIDDQQSLQALANFATSLTTAQDKIAGLQNLVDAVASKMGGDFDAAKQKVIDFNAAIAAMPGITNGVQGFDPAVFEQVTNSIMSIEQGTEALGRLPEPFIAAIPPAQQAEEAFQGDAQALENIATQSQQTSGVIVNLGNAGQEAGDKVAGGLNNGKEAASGFGGAMQKAGTALQMAFGLGVYQIVNNVINLIKSGVQDGIDFAQSMFLIGTAVDQMRAAGIDVQFKDLSSIITDLGPKLQAFSNLDLSKVVGQVAAIGGQFGATRDQIETLVEFSLVAQERLGTDATTNANTLTAALLNITNARSAQILRNMGMEISAQDVYNEAVQLGIDNGAKTYKDLTDQEKIQAGINLIAQQRVDWEKWEQTYNDTAAGKVKDLGAAWQNLWTGWGVAITNLMPQLIIMFDFVIGAIAVVSGGLQTMIEMLQGGSWANFADELEKNINTVYDLYTNPPPSAVTGVGGPSTTPVNLNPPSTGGVDTAAADQLKIEADAEKEIVSLHDSEAAALEKIQTDLGNKLVDIDTQTAQKELAIEVDKANKLTDINLKYSRDMQALQVDEANKAQAIQDNTAETLLTDAEKKRLDDLQAEQKYQESLQSLRDQFGLNLEDALRSRDAKSVIHLIEQYDLQKTEKAQQYADETLVRNQNYQQEIDLANQKEAYDLQQLQKETQQRAQVLATQRTQEITDLNTDIARRQVALAVEQQNEIDAANLQAQRQNDAEVTDINNRLTAWEDGLQVQYNLTDAQMKNIYDNINAYLGAGGMVDSIYTYIIARMAQVYAVLGGGGTGTGPGAVTSGAVKPMASGGSLFANTPTSVVFGDAGPELAMFMPLGSNFGGAPSVSFAGGQGGSLQLQLLLDPNLEARIVQTSLSNVSLAIDRVQREQ